MDSNLLFFSAYKWESRILYGNSIMVKMNIVGFWVRRILVDTESFCDIIFLDAFKQISISKKDLNMHVGSLTGFSVTITLTIEIISLRITFREAPHQVLLKVEHNHGCLLTIQYHTRVTLSKHFRCCSSTLDQVTKFPNEYEIRKISSNQIINQSC